VATTLRDADDSSDAQVAAIEDHMLEFLAWLGEQPAAREIAADQLRRVPQFRTTLLRLRQPNAGSLRGPVVKKTNLSAARRADLVALLDALEPAVYVLSTMHYRDYVPPVRFGAPGA
jgi:hypothetical protein